MNKNYVHTLAYNLPSEVIKVMVLLHELHYEKNFHHILVDLGFPLVHDDINIDIDYAKKSNTELLTDIARHFHSEYLKLDNIGCSQNWSMVYDHIRPDDSDILCCADPDEHPKDKNWIDAIGKVIRADPQYAWVSLIMPEHFPILNKTNTIEKIVGGIRVWEIIGNINWAQGGFNCKFLNEVGGIPFLDSHPIYGHIETASLYMMNELGYKWCMLPDYVVEHTDYEKGSEGSSRLLREWKNFIIYNIDRYGQITLEDYLNKRKTGEITI